jgi:4-amino-4-deoxy-L-arabinose transferase-like glycosyltransferase
MPPVNVEWAAPLTVTSPARSRTLPTALVLGAILAAAAALRIWGIGFGLPHTQARPDETQVIDAALAFLKGQFPRFYDYPWLYMWLLTVLYLGYFAWSAAAGVFRDLGTFVASWPLHWEPFFLISRSLSASAGTATVLVVYQLARKVGGTGTGLVAALFMALAFLPVRESHFGTTDSMMTLLIVASVSALFSAHGTGRLLLFGLAGALGGLATATKYNAVFVVVPMLVSQLMHLFDAPAKDRLRVAFDKRLLHFGGAFALALAIGVPFIVFDWPRFSVAMGELLHSTKHGMGNASLEPGWIHHIKLSLRYGLGLPLFLVSLAGAATLLASHGRTALLLLAFPASYYLVAGSVGNLFVRYALPVVPFLCVCAAWLVTSVIRRVTPPGQPLVAPVLTAVVSALIVLPSLRSCWRFDTIMAATDNRVIIAEWFKASVPAGESVLQTGTVYGHAQLDRRLWNPWIWDRNAQIFRVDGRPATGRPDWILVQESPLPSSTQPIVKQFLKDGYQVAWQFRAFTPRLPGIYDLQDSFFVPYAGFDGVERPGPNFTLYRRAIAKSRDVPSS